MSKDVGDFTESPSLHNTTPGGNISPISPFDEDGERVDEWIEKLLSGPLPAELADSPPTNTTGGISSEMFSNDLGSPSIIMTATTTSTGGMSTQMFANDLGSPLTTTTTGGISSEMFSDDLGGLGIRSNSGSGSGSSSHGWENGTVDNECGVVDSNLSYLGSGFPFAASGASLYPVTRKPVIPPANGNGVHIPPVDLKNLLIRCKLIWTSMFVLYLTSTYSGNIAVYHVVLSGSALGIPEGNFHVGFNMVLTNLDTRCGTFF